MDFEEARTEVAESRRIAQVATSRNSALEKELDELRQQQASMVECMNAYDRQLGELTDREQSIQALSNAAKETVQDAILQRDMAQQEVSQLRDRTRWTVEVTLHVRDTRFCRLVARARFLCFCECLGLCLAGRAR